MEFCDQFLVLYLVYSLQYVQEKGDWKLYCMKNLGKFSLGKRILGDIIDVCKYLRRCYIGEKWFFLCGIKESWKLQGNLFWFNEKEIFFVCGDSLGWYSF